MDAAEIPEYLVYKNVRQLIMFNGLNVNNNNVHKSIYASFVNLKRINYRLLTADYEQPRKASEKAARSPRGILKRDWPLKHLSQRPALVVVFVELGWRDPNFSEKLLECESKITSIRRNVVYRDTRVALVLVQQANLDSLNDDSSLAKERAVELCSLCQLSEKQLFVFPTGEDHAHVTSRLDGLFYDIAQQYYLGLVRRVRSRAIPNNYSNLLICQQYKLGFLSELRQDTHSALRCVRVYRRNLQTFAISDRTSKHIKHALKRMFRAANSTNIIQWRRFSITKSVFCIINLRSAFKSLDL